MAGVLLSPGPVSTHASVRRLSRVFRDGMSKAKFMTATKKLTEAGFGTNVNAGPNVFVKRPPEQVVSLLKSNDIVTLEEYEVGYRKPISKGISDKLQQMLVAMGAVRADAFCV